MLCHGVCQRAECTIKQTFWSPRMLKILCCRHKYVGCLYYQYYGRQKNKLLEKLEESYYLDYNRLLQYNIPISVETAAINLIISPPKQISYNHSML